MLPPFRIFHSLVVGTLAGGRAPAATLALTVGLLGGLGCGGDDASAPEPAPKPDAAVDAGKPDAKVSSVPDTGTKPARDADVSSGNPALDALAGRYLMRWDTFGTGVTGIGPVTISIRSRVSFLFVTELSVEGDHLKATERLCNQTAKQKCLMGCETATTVVDQRVVDNFLHKTVFSREYTLGSDGKALTAGESIAALGYDGTGDLPTSSSDSKV
ncbi:MAG: hypothetical protein JWN48_453, partial [Myxococcaceae bacterium]|nr:hypothetical protein [Myxococcaceae bacterium]